MAAMLERVINDTTSDLSHLKQTLAGNADYHKQMQGAQFPKPSADTIAQQRLLPFSALEDVLQITKGLEEELARVRGEVQKGDVVMAELQSKMLKSELKHPCERVLAGIRAVAICAQTLTKQPT